MAAATETKANIDELKFLLSQSKQQAVRYVLEEELAKHNKVLANAAPAVKKSIVKSGGQMKKISNYAWDDAGKVVKIYVTGLKQADETIDKENIEAKFEERSFTVIIRKVGPKNMNHTLTVVNLLKEIAPEGCKVTASKTGVNITLAKVKPNSIWSSLKASKEEKKEEMPKMDKDADPNAGLMTLMKQMYETGDDEMKRQISKSMYESQQKQLKGESGGMPGMPGMGGMGGMPGMGGMAGMPGMGGMAGMPDMGDMGAGLDSL